MSDRAPGRLKAAPTIAAVALAWNALFVPAATAQDVAVVRLTLEDAQARALAVSHRIAEARARGSAADSAADATEAASRPQVTASAGYSRTSHVTEFIVPSAIGPPRLLYPDLPNNYRARLDLQWPIYTGGRADALERAARAEASAVGAEIAVAQADLRLEVARSFWAVVTADAAVAVLEQGVARAQAHVADVGARYDAGLVPPNEIASAEAQASRQRMLLIEARGQREVMSADFDRLVGAGPTESAEPAAVLDEGPQVSASVETAVAEARASRQERVALERRIEAATNQRVAASAGRRPLVLLGSGLDFARPNPRIFPRVDRWDDFWEVGVNVSWSLWDGGRVAADEAQAASLADAARHRLAEFDSLLTVEVRQRLQEIDSGHAAVAAAADAVRAATEARRVVDERYQAGVIAQIEVLDAEQALLQAQLDRTRALAGVRLAEARLVRAMGR